MSDGKDPMIKKCGVLDDDKCIIMYEYLYASKEIIIHVLKEKICPEPVNVLGKEPQKMNV